MSSHTKESISNSLETEPHLLPHMPYLLQDLWALGSSLDQLVDIIASLHLAPASTQLLDLGCGKGAVSIKLAERYGFRAYGIDAMAPFIEDARKKAQEYQVSQLCRFEQQDLLTYLAVTHDFDLVILASLGGVLGSLTDTIAKLRTQVRTDGYIIIDDGYLKNQNQLNRKGYQHYRNHDHTIRQLTAFQDRLVTEVNTSAACKKINADYLAFIRKRGNELGLQYPGLKEALNQYLQLQAEECDLLDNEVEGALWVLQKKGQEFMPQER